MNRLLVFTSTALVSVMTWSGAQAHQSDATIAPIDFDQLTYAGSGCSADDTPPRFLYNHHSGRFVATFKSMNLNLEDRGIERKTCSLALPIEVTENQRVVIGSPSIFGQTRIGDEATFDFKSEVFFAGEQGPQVTKTISSESRGRRYFYERLPEEISSECGASTTVRVNLSMLGRQASPSATASAAVNGTALNIRVVDCEDAQAE